MNRRVLRMLALALALALAAAHPAGADYETGRRAWEAGQVDEAAARWRAAAQAGDRRAMLALGRLHVQGLGVLQDYVQAHVWFNLAASRGEVAAADEREAVAAKMLPEQIARAQALAVAWRPEVKESGGERDVAGAPVTDAAADAGPPPPRAIREAQRLLVTLGYRPGPADGIWGVRTERAWRSFLGDAGLPASETLTPAGLRALREIAERQRTAAEPEQTVPAGADPQTSRDTGVARPAPGTPDTLHRAAQAGNVDGLNATLAAGADVNARDGRGWTALMHAANKGYPLLVDTLLGAGADPDIRAPDGATALFIAALHGFSEIFAVLVQAGADASIPGARDRTPLEMAQALEHSKILALPEVAALREAEARREREQAEREEREAQRRRAEAESLAFAEAESADTVRAYAAYLSSWCPGGDSCATARTQLDDSIRAELPGKSFGGINSLGDEQRYAFRADSKADAEVGPSHRPRAWASGTWEVGGGRIRIKLEWAGGVGRSVVEAAWDGEVLSGREHFTREGVAVFFGSKTSSWTWRFRERAQFEVEAERDASRPRTSRSADDTRDGQ